MYGADHNLRAEVQHFRDKDLPVIDQTQTLPYQNLNKLYPNPTQTTQTLRKLHQPKPYPTDVFSFT